jgi:hypothetical protein
MLYAVRYDSEGIPCFVLGSDMHAKRLTKERADKVAQDLIDRTDKTNVQVVEYDSVPTELRSGA